MSTSRASATTTYPFYATTYTNPSPSAPSSYPTTYTDTTWLPPTSADTHCVSATAYPSVRGPQGLKAACVISNAADINPNAFWDVYECCPGHDLSAYGYSYTGDETPNPGICMMQCTIGDDGTTWQQVGECLQKRAKEVVCAPRFEERSYNDTLASGSSTRPGVTVQATRPGGNSASSATATASTAAATSVDIVHLNCSKLALFAFGLLTLGSAAGLFL
ncbi:hypothetical protein SVAN01_05275 [Stagonosporopsis vannaccii]|nr:hypothetical protein SVAN01_05275 [Stagonosporopsis vannaccii]